MEENRMGSMIAVPIAPALEREVLLRSNTRKFPRIETVPFCASIDAVATMNKSWKAVQGRGRGVLPGGVLLVATMNKSWKGVQDK